MRKPFIFDLQLFADGDGSTTTPTTDVDESKLDDHAKSVLARTREEAKKHREGKEAERIAREAAEKRAAEAEAKIAEREKKDLEDQKEYKKLADRVQAEKAELEAKYKTELSTRDAALVREAVARAASKAGIIDDDDVDLPVFAAALKLAKIEDGRVKGADDVAAEMKKLKPAKFKSSDDDGGRGDSDRDRYEREERERQDRERRERDSDGRFRPRDQSRDSNGKIDFAKLSDEAFEEAEARLRGQRT